MIRYKSIMEPCQSGLTYLFAKEAGCKSPRWFESSRLRSYKNDSMESFFVERSRASKLLCWRAGVAGAGGG